MGVERTESVGETESGAGAAGVVNGAAPRHDAAAEPPKKKLKLAHDELRARLLDHKLLRLKHVRDRFTEQLSELYFLQAGGNMMDYVVWRKRPPAPQLLAFLEARRPASPPPAPAPLPAPAPAPAPVAAVAAGSTSASAAQDEMVEKARQEAYVAGRVAELVRAGLWTERRLPRVLEPPRPKTHWDYLLEEMAWLAQDFAHERKWKKQAAKKCARAVQKYFQDKAQAAQKAEKAQELQLRKIAAFAAKEIRTFWSNVEKLVEWKRSKRVERARKEALDEQLSYMVDRTERYSRQLAAGLAGGVGVGGETPPSDDEFRPRGESSDDEETIAAAERAGPRDHRAELDALRRDSRTALPDLLPPGYRPATGDYSPAEESADDEDTIAEQERRERAADVAAEVDALCDEADLDLAELMRRYRADAPPPHSPTHSSHDQEDDDASSTASDESSTSSRASSSASDSSRLAALVEDAGGAGDGAGGGAAGGGESAAEALSAAAARLQPTGTTLAATAVGTPVPRLLKHTLREYQHVGLHWLATMHARRLNGILADEMGLGKTIQTIALLAHLALERHDWGPHLVVAPTSVLLNWEMEFKKWCPAFKILVYYGTIKERKLKRVGWTKPNSFHVCITSYKLVVQDHQSFRRKRWKYLILDEAQNIKNFKSQRWQLLLNFQTERRLLLTGTPLQNSLLELWSLMHFLMPEVFASHSEFKEWFTPLAGLAEGEAGGEAAGEEDPLVRRLHEVLRPFLLRRLKADVERQMPKKYEHVLMCRLSKRQRCLYDDFMSRAKTKESLSSGNLLSVINVLMQLRKVCNHPDLFEPRPVSSPLHLPPLEAGVPALVARDAAARLLRAAAAAALGLATAEAAGAQAFPAHRARHLAPPRRLLEELPPPPPPRPPPARLRLHLRLVPRAPHRAAPRPAPPLRLALPPPAAPAPPAAAPPEPARSPAAARLEARRRACRTRLAADNERRCWRLPLYGADLRAALLAPPPALPPSAAPPDLHQLLRLHRQELDTFTVCWRAAVAPPARAHPALPPPAPELGELLRAALAAWHGSVLRQAVSFPHPRLLQYDCGKLQTLAALLRRLRTGGHRVLIFTQMTRVLDVLEAFLSLHGHTYLRLDGATRVDRRQALVDRFNADPRVFAFILSTRSGGVGLNLTGADCVVFYDSDWNPTMDAQAQDRCHRIGQTRDVHVYRLVSAATVEENILRKADQKRALNHLAIEHGHFTTNYLRAANIEELFGASSSSDPSIGAGEAAGGAGSGAGGASGASGAGSLESALAAAEDEADAAAAAAARAEALQDSDEFDETRGPDAAPPAAAATAPAEPLDPDALELAALMKQLSPVEKYAMRLVEASDDNELAERDALEHVRSRLREWGQRAKDPPPPPPPPPALSSDDDEPLTYSREESRTQVWESCVGGTPPQRMPMWSPPTPPAAGGDVYVEQWARALYRAGAAPDALLPVAARPTAAVPRRARPVPRAHAAPPSLFERARPPRRHHAPHHAHHAPPSPPQPEWTAAEDAALRRALRLQRLPPDPPPALTPNWDWCAELVHELRRAYRGPRACRDRHERLADPARRKPRRVPARAPRTPPHRRRDDDAPRPPLARLDAMRDAAERRRQAPKRRYDEPSANNTKHQALLADHGVDYDAPPSPMEVASRRADRIAKEKLKAGGAQATPSAAPAAAAPANPTVQAAGAPRVVVAHAGGVTAAAAAAAAGSKAEPRRRAPDAATLQLYRQQAIARQHLKILHQQQPQSVTVSVGGVGGAVPAGAVSVSAGGGGVQVSLRRAAPRLLAPAPGAGPPAPPAPHVVVAHLGPRAHAPHHPPPDRHA